MKVNINLASLKSMRWPISCPVCGELATALASTSITATGNYGYYVVALKWTNKTLSLNYPICVKHRWGAQLLDYPARCGFIRAALSFLLLPALAVVGFILCVLVPLSWILRTYGMSIGTTTAIGEILPGMAAICFYGIAALIYVAAITHKPVALLSLKDNRIEVDIRDPQYFGEFCKANSIDSHSTGVRTGSADVGLAYLSGAALGKVIKRFVRTK